MSADDGWIRDDQLFWKFTKKRLLASKVENADTYESERYNDFIDETIDEYEQEHEYVVKKKMVSL